MESAEHTAAQNADYVRGGTAYRDARIITLRARLLDYTGHVTKGLSRDDARCLLDEINSLRAMNGWKPLDMTGRWRRPRSKHLDGSGAAR